MKNVQLFITRHYDAIKLIMLTINLALLSYLILGFVAQTQASSERRSEAISQAVKQINDKTDEQTVIINRQFQALCFLIIETSGQEALKQLDPPLEEQCRDLTQELKEDQTAFTPPFTIPPSQPGSNQAQPTSNPSPQKAKGTPLEDTPPMPLEKKPTFTERATEAIDNLLSLPNNLLRRL